MPQDFAGWRLQGRQLIHAGIQPDAVAWRESTPRTGGRLALDEGVWEAPPLLSEEQRAFSVPRDFVEKAERVFYHRSEKKWALLYRMLWRIVHENHNLLDDRVDDDVSSFMDMEHKVRRDAHKMKAFVRFRKIQGQDHEEYVAWHEPDHPLLPYVVPFFKDRFSSMVWTILTPDASARWDGETLSWGRGCLQHEGPSADSLEDLWSCYYTSIFNPARVKLKAMKAEMPTRYWKSMPETRDIARLLAESDRRVAEMIERSPRDATAFVPQNGSYEELKSAASRCTACKLCEAATQTVFGEGPHTARIMIVGEQPGDQEDQAGRPFVGPAGEILDQALKAAGIERETVYLTNAVKHFKFTWQNKQRLHEKPAPRDVAACKPWLLAERHRIQPDLVICLGLTAALSVFGRSFRLKDVRGVIQPSSFARLSMSTYHPAHVLRLTDPQQQAEAFQELVQDLQKSVTLWRHSREQALSLNEGFPGL
jgi:DNA polymerase